MPGPRLLTRRRSPLTGEPARRGLSRYRSCGDDRHRLHRHLRLYTIKRQRWHSTSGRRDLVFSRRVRCRDAGRSAVRRLFRWHGARRRVWPQPAPPDARPALEGLRSDGGRDSLARRDGGNDRDRAAAERSEREDDAGRASGWLASRKRWGASNLVRNAPTFVGEETDGTRRGPGRLRLWHRLGREGEEAWPSRV